MNKKKKIIQLTEGILLCCVIVVMTLLCIGIIKKEVKNTKGKLTETIGWYRIQDNKKVQVDLNQKIKADPQGKQKKISDWKYEADQDMYCNKKRRNINDRL